MINSLNVCSFILFIGCMGKIHWGHLVVEDRVGPLALVVYIHIVHEVSPYLCELIGSQFDQGYGKSTALGGMIDIGFETSYMLSLSGIG